jgi:hypothetical protein
MIKNNRKYATKKGEARFHVHIKITEGDMLDVEMLKALALSLNMKEPTLATLYRRGLSLLADTYQNKLLEVLASSPQNEGPSEKRARIQAVMAEEAAAMSKAAGAKRGGPRIEEAASLAVS